MPIYTDPACLALLEAHYGRSVVSQPATPLCKMPSDPKGPIRIEHGADGRLVVRYPADEVVETLRTGCEVVETLPTACEVVETLPTACEVVSLSEEEEERAILQRWLARVLAPKNAA